MFSPLSATLTSNFNRKCGTDQLSCYLYRFCFAMRFAPRERRAEARKNMNWRLGLIDQAMVNGVERKLQTVGNAQLIEDIVQMVFYSLLTDE